MKSKKRDLTNHKPMVYSISMTPKMLKKWRADNGHTQATLAKELGVTNIAVYRWESGARKIPTFLHLALTSLEQKGKIQNRKEVI